MIITILSIISFSILTILGLIHFNWVFGGKWGFEQSIPTKENGEKLLNPKKIETAIVGIGLILFGLIYLIKTGLINVSIPMWITNYGYWIIPSIFILRAIGEFKYVGFFKQIKNTEFAKADSKIFSPLCLIIGIIGILIQFISK